MSAMSIVAFPSLLAFFSMPGGAEWIVILVIGLLLFGRRLPDVGRGLGQGIREFKRGLKDVESDVKADEPARKSLPGEQVAQSSETAQSRAEQR